MAMILGFYHESRVTLNRKEGFARVEYLSPEDQSLVKAIAIWVEKDLKVLLDKQKVYSIAEQYAAGGLRYLKEAAFDMEHGSFIKRFESLLVEIYEKLEQSEN